MFGCDGGHPGGPYQEVMVMVMVIVMAWDGGRAVHGQVERGGNGPSKLSPLAPN